MTSAKVAILRVCFMIYLNACVGQTEGEAAVMSTATLIFNVLSECSWRMHVTVPVACAPEHHAEPAC
ncbi:hypothetical protein EYB39_22665 [Pantoea agglomerans]|nr:hypothetical protein EYB39_22665 [Pantoea agglomerans]